MTDQEEDYYHELQNVDMDITLRKFKNGRWGILCSKPGKGYYYKVIDISFIEAVAFMKLFKKHQKLDVGKNEQFLTFDLDMEE
jgi:hypothetical protein